MFGQERQVWLMLVFSLALALNGCGPSPAPTGPPVAVGTPEAPTPTPVPPTPTTSTMLSSSPAPPTLEPVTSRFLYVQGVTVSTLAGDGHLGYRDGPALQARFAGTIGGMAIDGQGNIYIPEPFAHRIRRITPDGMVSTLAGTGSPGYADGPIATAQFNGAVGLAVDAAGNVYVADGGNHCIRLIRPDVRLPDETRRHERRVLIKRGRLDLHRVDVGHGHLRDDA